MFTAILLIICCGQLMVTTVNTVEEKELEEIQSRQDRSINAVTLTVGGSKCIFPFFFEGVEYNACAPGTIQPHPWCATSINDDKTVKTWGVCAVPKESLADQCLQFSGVIFGDKCLYFSINTEIKNWEEAKDACSAIKGELAIFADNPKGALQFIEDQDTDVSRYWVGATDSNLEGHWEWDNGDPILWPIHTAPWGAYEPNGEGHENCLDVMRVGDDHGFNDEHCDNQHQYICEIGCPFAGTIYPPGSFIHEACAQLQCNGATGRFDNLGYDDHCPQCYAWGDPHIIPFDQSSSSYSFQKCGNYSLTQMGNYFRPSYAVFASFVSCTYYDSSLACVDTVTFKNDNHTHITIGYQDNKLMIQVNDKDLNSDSLSSSPSNVNVDSTDYPVLAWISEYTNTDHKANCVSLQGSSGIKVKFCGTPLGNANGVHVWASPDILNGLNGLCGTANGNINDDFTTRDGGQTWSFTEHPPVAFGLSWIADSKNPGRSCGGRMQTENQCETNTSVSVIFRSQCEDAVLNGFFTAEKDLSQILIDACVYDLCAATDPVKGIEAVHASMPIHAHIQENTVSHCHHKRTHKCKTHNGKCILKTETCDGTIIDRGCHGRKCDCCAPSGCKQSFKCLQKQGKCLLLKDAMNCDGIVNSELCSGNKCACCYPKEQKTCKKSSKCVKVNGECISKMNWKSCDGKLNKNWCKGKKCGCCYPK